MTGPPANDRPSHTAPVSMNKTLTFAEYRKRIYEISETIERCAKIAEEARCHEEDCNHEACLRATRIAQQIRDNK